MAQLPSLALGLGLQGKPIDRAALNLRRAEGEERAALRAQQRAQKELEPIKKRFMDIGGKAYLPVHREMIAKKQAEGLKYIFDNVDDVDRMKVSQMLADLESSSFIAQQEYKNFQKLSTDPKFSHLNKGLSDVLKFTDPETLNSSMANRADFNVSMTPDGVMNWNVYNQMPTETAVSDYIKSLGDRAFESIEDATTATVGGQQQIIRKPKAGLFEEAYNFAVNNPDTYRTESAQLQEELIPLGKMPDLSDPKGKVEFDAMVKDRIAQKTRSAMDFEKSKGVGKGFNLTVNTGDTQKGGVMQPYETEMMLSFGGKIGTKTAKSYATVNFKDQDVTAPPSTDARYVDGTPVGDIGTSKFNQVGVSYVVSEPFDFKYEGQSFKIPKGAIVPKEFEKFLVEKGMPIKAQILAWFQDPNGNWAYRNADGFYQSLFMGESEADKKRIKEIKDTQISLQKQVEKNKPKKQSSSSQSGQAPKEGSEVKKDADYYKKKYKTTFQTK